MKRPRATPTDVHALAVQLEPFPPGDLMPVTDRPGAATPAAAREWRPPSYWPFVLPAMIVVLAVIVFPWAFTIWMSLHEWKVGAPTTYVGLSNYLRLPGDPRFVDAVWQTL